MLPLTACDTGEGAVLSLSFPYAMDDRSPLAQSLLRRRSCVSSGIEAGGKEGVGVATSEVPCPAGSGVALLSNLEQLLRGVWKPETNEILHMSL